MEHSNETENLLLKSISSDKVSEIAADIAEAGIDQFIDNDFLKDIPILGIGIKGYELARRISESFYRKKIIKFLFELKNIPISKRISFIEKLEGNAKEGRKVGEAILVILNRLDDIDKASIIGKLFKAYINEDIGLPDFLRLSHIVDRLFIADLASLKGNSMLYNITSDVKESLAFAGILKQKIKDNRKVEEYMRNQLDSKIEVQPRFEYEVNNFGQLLIKFGL